MWIECVFFGVDCQEERTTPKDCHTNDVDDGNPCKRSNSNDNNDCKKKHAYLKYYTCIEQESESEKVRTVKREREHNLYFFILVFFCIVHVNVQNTLLICRSMLIHMNQTKPKRTERLPKFNAPKAYHMFIATITASVTHSS